MKITREIYLYKQQLSSISKMRFELLKVEQVLRLQSNQTVVEILFRQLRKVAKKLAHNMAKWLE